MSETGILDGIRVLTLEQVHALPWGTSFLADFGAQVIRVESVDHMQDRRSGPFAEGNAGEEWWNEGGNLAYFGTRNKESLCLEVVHPRGKEVFLKLVKNCDVVTDNFRPGTMRRLGFDHESLIQVNPRIITLSCTAYGHTGPWRAAGSRARTVDAACGLSYLTGYEGGPSARASSNYMDHSVSNNVAYALLLAIYHRRKTGKGMRIDMSMQETGVSAIGPAILEAQRGISRPRLGCAHIWKRPIMSIPAREKTGGLPSPSPPMKSGVDSGKPWVNRAGQPATDMTQSWAASSTAVSWMSSWGNGPPHKRPGGSKNNCKSMGWPPARR